MYKWLNLFYKGSGFVTVLIIVTITNYNFLYSSLNFELFVIPLITVLGQEYGGNVSVNKR